MKGSAKSTWLFDARVFACFLVLTAICRVSPAANVPAGWRTYRSPDYGFTIAYHADVTFYPVRPDLKEAQRSFILVCQSRSIACFEYTDNEYDGTNFEAAGLSVNILREARTDEECNRIDTGSYPIKRKTINGIPFHYGITEGVATGHAIGGPTYRAFYQNVCFELALYTTATNIGAYDPGVVRQFDAAKLEKQLDRILHTFRFVGPVVDGPGWRVHAGDGCDGIFEYPETDVVVTAIESANESLHSNDITCEEYFSDGGLNYTVAQKVNLQDRHEFERWLKSFGYPDLSEARVEAASEYLTKYKAGSYYYIYGEGTAFILSVSDAKHRAVNPDSNRVFRHFLNSFRAN